MTIGALSFPINAYNGLYAPNYSFSRSSCFFFLFIHSFSGFLLLCDQHVFGDAQYVAMPEAVERVLMRNRSVSELQVRALICILCARFQQRSIYFGAFLFSTFFFFFFFFFFFLFFFSADANAPEHFGCLRRSGSWWFLRTPATSLMQQRQSRTLLRTPPWYQVRMTLTTNPRFSAPPACRRKLARTFFTSILTRASVKVSVGIFVVMGLRTLSFLARFTYHQVLFLYSCH